MSASPARGLLRLAPAFALGALTHAVDAHDLVIPPIRYPPIPALAARAEGFVPSGWRIVLRTDGDMNGDGRDDLAMILRDADPKNVVKNDGFGPPAFDTNPYVLVVALRRPDGGYQLTAADHTLIPRATQPNIDDYLEDATPATIRRGVLRIGLRLFANAGGADLAQVTFSFRLEQGHLRLIGYDNNDVQRMSGETLDVSVDFLTRRVKTTKGRIDRDGGKVTWSALPPAAPLTLERIGDGMDFDPLHPPR